MKEIKVQNLLDVGLARVLGESGAKALLHYAKRHYGYIEGDLSRLDALEEALKELFGAGSSLILRSVEAEIASSLGAKPPMKHPSNLSDFVTKIMKNRSKGKPTKPVLGALEIHQA